MKSEKNKKKFTLFLLVYFILFTSCFSIVTLSKYVGASLGNGNSSIAKWGVSLDTSDNASDTLNIIKGKTTQNYILKIQSTSETKAIYSIILSDLPNGLEASIDGVNFLTAVNNQITFDNVGFINANAQQKTVTKTISFRVPIDSEALDENTININVDFKQASPIS